MWPLNRLTGLCALLSCLATPLWAQDRPPAPGPERLARAEYLSRNGFELADANHDGRLDRTEWLARHWTLFRDYDADGDERLSVEEYLDKNCGGLPQPHLGWCQNSARSDFRRYARRSFITRVSLAPSAGSNFRFNDLNRDGFVTRQEELSASGVGHP